MRKPDFEDFRKLLDQQAEIFRSPKPSDVLVQAYWQALTDVPIEAVQRCGALHLKRGKFFPKPVELRPKDIPPYENTGPGPTFEADQRRSIALWDERLRVDPARAKWHLLCAYLARTDCEDPASIVYAERIAFCRAAAHRLLAEFGPLGPVADTHCMHAASRLLGGASIHAGVVA